MAVKVVVDFVQRDARSKEFDNVLGRLSSSCWLRVGNVLAIGCRRIWDSQTKVCERDDDKTIERVGGDGSVQGGDLQFELDVLLDAV